MSAFCRGLLVALSLTAAGPALCGPPFNVDDPGTAGADRYNLFLNWASNRCPEGHTYMNSGMSLAYGVRPNVEIGVAAGRASVLGQNEDRSGWGDTSVCVKWRFQEEDRRRPQWAAVYQVSLPTGGDLGTDCTVHSAYLTGAKEIGPGTLLGNIGGSHYRGARRENSLLYGLAYPVAVNGKVSLGPQVYGYSATETGGPAELAWGVGGTYQATGNQTVLLQLGRSTRGNSDINLYVGAVFDIAP